jgi:hypothetical protein
MRKMHGHSGGSGPHSSGSRKPAGHIDSVMGRQYPSTMAVKGRSVGTSTANGPKNRKMR